MIGADDRLEIWNKDDSDTYFSGQEDLRHLELGGGPRHFLIGRICVARGLPPLPFQPPAHLPRCRARGERAGTGRHEETSPVPGMTAAPPIESASSEGST